MTPDPLDLNAIRVHAVTVLTCADDMSQAAALAYAIGKPSCSPRVETVRTTAEVLMGAHRDLRALIEYAGALEATISRMHAEHSTSSSTTPSGAE